MTDIQKSKPLKLAFFASFFFIVKLKKLKITAGLLHAAANINAN